MTARASAHSMLASAVRSGMAAKSSPAVITGKGYARPVRDVRNLGTYWAQRAASSRLRPVSAGYPFDARASIGAGIGLASGNIRPGQCRKEHVMASVGYHAQVFSPV